MKNTKKVKYNIRPWLWKELYDTYWDDVIEKVESTEYNRIKSRNNSFIIFKQMTIKQKEYIINKIWFTYMWYLIWIIDTLDYNNSVNFRILKHFWVSDPMIKIVRKKFKDNNIVKKFWNMFYLNPEIAQKWDSIPDYVLMLFANK